MTQTLLAELAGLERDRLNKVEHGRRQLKATEAARIAAVLGVSVSDLEPRADPMRFRDRAEGPAAKAAIELFGRYIHNCEIIDTLKAFDAD
jgi:transcriptional regulator with XRE-family HTH domain